MPPISQPRTSSVNPKAAPHLQPSIKSQANTPTAARSLNIQLRHTLPLAATLLAAATLPLQAASIQTGYDHNVAFGALHTYVWGKASTANPLFTTQIQAAVDRDLQSKGWQLLPVNAEMPPEATLFAIGEIQSQQQLDSFYSSFGPGWQDEPGPGFEHALAHPLSHPSNHLVIDIFSTQSKQLAFRGIASEDQKSTPDQTTKQLDKDIASIFKNFPPHPKL